MLTSPLSSGGYGKVVIAKHHDLGFKVCIKLYHEESSDECTHEASIYKLLEPLQKPSGCVLAVLGSGSLPPVSYLTLPLWGRSLRRCMSSMQGDDMSVAGRQLIMAVKQIHACRVLHLDLKPCNVTVQRHFS